MKTKTFLAILAFLAISLAGCAGSGKSNDKSEQKENIPMELSEFKDIKLQVPDTAGGKPLMQCVQERQSFREFENRNLSLKHLSEILWVASGINRPEENKRTVPSASAIYPLETYAFLANGVYRYNPQKHELEAFIEGDHRSLTGLKPFVDAAPLTIVFIADFNKYIQSGMPIPADKYLYLAGVEAGCSAQDVYLYCASEGLKSVVHGGAKQKKLLELLNLGENHEFVLAHTVGY